MNISQVRSMLTERNLVRWIPFAAITTVLCGLIFLVAQQNLRLSANDPQIQMAEDAAQAINAGQPVPTQPPQVSIDISKSLTTFLVFYDDQGKVLASNGKLDGEMPTLPAGVFAYVRARGEDRITWQPRRGVRIASVVTRYQSGTSGFIMVGRSLREVEKRINKIGMLVAVGWLLSLVISFISLAYRCQTKPQAAPSVEPNQTI